MPAPSCIPDADPQFEPSGLVGPARLLARCPAGMAVAHRDRGTPAVVGPVWRQQMRPDPTVEQVLRLAVPDPGESEDRDPGTGSRCSPSSLKKAVASAVAP